jgi:hypothetical protein
MSEVVRNFLSHWLGLFLKGYNVDSIRPKPPGREQEEINSPCFVDRFSERNDGDPEIEKLNDAISKAKWLAGDR